MRRYTLWNPPCKATPASYPRAESRHNAVATTVPTHSGTRSGDTAALASETELTLRPGGHRDERVQGTNRLNNKDSAAETLL